ncbi:MAG: (deoxy)nucleoside triphosphate pyrophosphohydrolase [Christensenellales bacterium]|jgi:8-oxo-dGTP diphosphatase
MKQVNTVAGLIFNDKGEILCTQRGDSKYDYIAFKWEFPGGKLEEGENDFQALSRELQEELEIEVEILEKFFQVEHTYKDFHLSMPIYKCKLLSSDIKLMVHTSIKWLHPSKMLTLDWAGADIPVAEKAKKVFGNENTLTK